eukprot:gene7778-8411_t
MMISFLLLAIVITFARVDARNLSDVVDGCLHVPYHRLYSFNRKFPSVQNYHLPCILREYLATNTSSDVEDVLSQLRVRGVQEESERSENVTLLGEKWISPSRYQLLQLHHLLNGSSIQHVVDIVVYVRPHEVLQLRSWLDVWRPQIETYHLLLLIDVPNIEEFESAHDLPEWLHYDLYTRYEIENSLPQNESWIFGEDDWSMLSFGFLASDRDIVVVLSLEVYPLIDEESGKHVYNVIEEHVANLLTPSYSEYNVFRHLPKMKVPKGIPSNAAQITVFSQGELLDRDTSRGWERSDHLRISNVPSGQFFSLNVKNFAFNRKMIGSILYFGAVTRLDSTALLKGIEDIFTGWIFRVVSSVFNYGIKIGFPVVQEHLSPVEKGEDATKFTANLEIGFLDSKKQQFLDDIFPFIRDLRYIINTILAAVGALDVSLVLKKYLSDRYPVIEHYSLAQGIWVTLWDGRNGGGFGLIDCYNPHDQEGIAAPICVNRFLPIAARSSMKRENPLTTCAVFTMVRNEATFLPLWIRYYERFVPSKDIWILDHNSTDGSTDRDKIAEGINVLKLVGDVAFSPHYFLNRNIELFQQRLLRAGYSCVLFAEVDEFIVPHPNSYPEGDLMTYFQDFRDNISYDTVTTNGFDVCHLSEGQIIEPDLDVNQNLIIQRNFWFPDILFGKSILTKIPVRYQPGFHSSFYRDKTRVYFDKTLFLVHFHYSDKILCLTREKYKYQQAKKLGKSNEQHLGVVHVANSYEDEEDAIRLLCVYALLTTDEESYILCPILKNNTRDFSCHMIYHIPQELRNFIYI